MLDPISLTVAVGAATKAFTAIKTAVAVSNDISDIHTSLSRWIKACSDIDNFHKNASNPSVFDKMFKGNIEQLALESFAAKKKMQSQRAELKNFIIGHYGGPKAWEELMREEGRIRKIKMENQYKTERLNKMIFEYTIVGVVLCVGLGIIITFAAILRDSLS